jgi:hypothetical protein
MKYFGSGNPICSTISREIRVPLKGRTTSLNFVDLQSNPKSVNLSITFNEDGSLNGKARCILSWSESTIGPINTLELEFLIRVSKQ